MKGKLSLKNVSVTLGKQPVLHQVSFSLNMEGILAVVGPSGSGKSTLLNTLGGIIKNYEGDISFDSRLIKEIVKGYVPQNLGLLPWKTVRDNIFLAKKINKHINISQKESSEIINNLDIANLLDRFPTEISGGQKQRAALARLFVSKPDLLLMDEPFSALDSFSAETSRSLFLNLWKKRKITTIFTTHNLSEAARLGKQLLILSKSPGRVLRIIDNPLFEKEEITRDEDFFEFEKYLTAIMNEEREKGNL